MVALMHIFCNQKALCLFLFLLSSVKLILLMHQRSLWIAEKLNLNFPPTRHQIPSSPSHFWPSYQHIFSVVEFCQPKFNHNFINFFCPKLHNLKKKSFIQTGIKNYQIFNRLSTKINENHIFSLIIQIFFCYNIEPRLIFLNEKKNLKSLFELKLRCLTTY